MPEPLSIFTVYENPSDYPGKFVVRRWLIVGGRPLADREPFAVADTLETARSSVPVGRAMLTRHRDDDPVIVEVWL